MQVQGSTPQFKIIELKVGEMSDTAEMGQVDSDQGG